MKVNYRLLISVFFLSLIVVSCGSKRKVVTTKKRQTSNKEVIQPKPTETNPTEPKKPVVEKVIKSQTRDATKDYILRFKDAAMSEMKLYKIPASITLAQGILESASGRGRLSVEANNHFGIKCHTAWTGARIYHDDDEKGECFRKYNDATYSYRDHSLFLTERKRYRGLFQLDIDDFKGWAQGLRKAGYATDPRYPQKLISLIKRYDLDKYDDQALEGMNVVKSSKVKPEVLIDDKNVHVVKAGDTLYALSVKYKTTIVELKRLNKLYTNNLTIGQVLKVK